MTQVQLLYRRPDGSTTGGVLLTEGLVKVNSVRRYDTSGGEMTTVAFMAALGATVTIDPGTWRFELWRVPNGRGGYLSGTDAVQYKLVPASGGPFQIDDLVDVTPTGETSTLDPEWKAYIDQQVATVGGGAPTGSGPGGAFVILDITDSTTVGRNVVKAADQAAGRTAIGAGTSSLVIGTTAGTSADGSTVVHNTGAETVAGVKTFSSAPGVPDASFTIAKTSGLQAALDAIVLTGGVVAAVHPTDVNVTRLTWA